MENAQTPSSGVELARGCAWAGWALMVIALLFAADAAITFVGLHKDVTDAQARIARRAAVASESARRSSPEELAAVRESVQRLSLPWPDLLKAVEAAASDDVALLAVEPDPKTGTVLISADAPDFLAALAYVRSLEASGGLSQVHLVRHERKAGALVFGVSADWIQRRVEDTQ